METFFIRNPLWWGIAALMIAINLSSCYVERQNIIRSEDLEIANPTPSPRDFVLNNSNHKVLLAVVDTGVDYNHPLLASSIHFELDQAGQPVRLGKDYVGEDLWPAPYLIRTSLYDPDRSEAEHSKAEKVRARLEAWRQLEPLDPFLSKVLEPRRQITQEIEATANHGTHVAGLMVYDRPDFGLLAYRVLPLNEQQPGREGVSYRQKALRHLIDSLDQAAKDGARIINLSLALDSKRAVPGDGASEVEEYKEYLELQKSFRDVINRHPDVLFVAANGNEGTWKDDANRLGLPCGINLPNVLCVGAIREDGDPTNFTNVMLHGGSTVYALGQNVLSTVPSYMCGDSSLKLLVDNDPSPSNASFLMAFKFSCGGKIKMERMSGTSMATPLVVHLAAEILAENPVYQPRQVIEEIQKRALPSFLGNLPVYKLKLKKPSWYAGTSTEGVDALSGSVFSGGTPSSSKAKKQGRIGQNEYFEFFVKKSIPEVR